MNIDIKDLKKKRKALQKVQAQAELEIENIDRELKALRPEENLENKCFVRELTPSNLIYTRFLFKTGEGYKSINYYVDSIDESNNECLLDFITFGLDNVEFLEQENLKEITLKEFADVVAPHNQNLLKITQSI